jgi:antirestriction protein ArdC
MSALYKFTTPYFLTFRQTQLLGGHIKKGSTGFPIVKWISPSRPTADDDDTRKRKCLFPITHFVFSADQTEGIPLPQSALVTPSTASRIQRCEAIIAGMLHPPVIIEGKYDPAYFCLLDQITMPAFRNFNPPEEYYSTLFHEMIHSTGHPKRLNRKELTHSLGRHSPEYAREELTAEMGAAFLCGITGVGSKTIDNSAAYVQSWLSNLQDDKKLVLIAAARAQAAADHILNESSSSGETIDDTDSSTADR